MIQLFPLSLEHNFSHTMATCKTFTFQLLKTWIVLLQFCIYAICFFVYREIHFVQDWNILHDQFVPGRHRQPVLGNSKERDSKDEGRERGILLRLQFVIILRQVILIGKLYVKSLPIKESLVKMKIQTCTGILST